MREGGRGREGWRPPAAVSFSARPRQHQAHVCVWSTERRAREERATAGSSTKLKVLSPGSSNKRKVQCLRYNV